MTSSTDKQRLRTLIAVGDLVPTVVDEAGCWADWDGVGVIGGVAGLKSRRCFLVVVGGGEGVELVAMERGAWVRVRFWVRVLGYGSYGVTLDCYGIICNLDDEI
ncbi:hypothetical protein Acr_00g0053560 [Actinidia rufa]|uniref:Uncharacterized protein n=1 Tax=Actinidia rufa TaxID=165716 RepID=A0A7J0DLM2_9ERIC|nr:hypothetical protein Acr_00g0053560 [Actinidia rufa]